MKSLICLTMGKLTDCHRRCHSVCASSGADTQNLLHVRQMCTAQKKFETQQLNHVHERVPIRWWMQ